MIDKMNIEVDVESLKRKIRSTLTDHNMPYGIKLEINEERGEYTLKSKQVKLAIRINEKWIGYELEINRSTLGKTIGAFSDTDNYEIQGEYAGASLDKFNEVYCCLRALLNNEIYVGKNGKRLYLAIPVSDKEFRMITRISYFSGSSHLTSKDEIENNQDLHRIFQ